MPRQHFALPPTSSKTGHRHERSRVWSDSLPASMRWRRLGMGIAALILLGAIPRTGGAHPEIPGATPAHPIALVGATIHPVSGPAIRDGILLLDRGKIVALGTEIEFPDETERIDVTGRHIYPGLFDPLSNLGLTEINSVRATRDDTEVGPFNPNVRAAVAVNPDSELIPVTRSNGVLLTLTAPQGGLVSGQSAVVQLDGWTYEEMTLLLSAGLHVQWPRMSNLLENPPSSRRAVSGQDELATLRQHFAHARAYQKARQSGSEKIDVRWEAMLPVLERQLPLIVTADEIRQIQSAVAFADREQVRLIIYGGYDAPHCAELLIKHKVPVIVGGVYRLPLRRSDPYDDAYTLPERLRQAGIPFCISTADRFGAANMRNLPYHAATAAAFGLPRDEAIKAITLYPAQILGVADRVGSLEAGKDATLIITTGDPLETATQVRGAYIEGRPVVLNDRHKRLYRKYREKYERGTAPE
jgi:imidazolonepropionase-like amidohydrolase